jgi:hypothetical protein
MLIKISPSIRLRSVTVVKSDNVGVRIMIEVLLVDLQKFFVRTKDEIQLGQLVLFDLTAA